MPDTSAPAASVKSSRVFIGIAWLWVGLPHAWGMTQTMSKTLDLFK